MNLFQALAFSDIIVAFSPLTALPMILDTISKEKRKEGLERKMAQLERDIDLIESHETIYVNWEQQREILGRHRQRSGADICTTHHRQHLYHNYRTHL